MKPPSGGFFMDGGPSWSCSNTGTVHYKNTGSTFGRKKAPAISPFTLSLALGAGVYDDGLKARAHGSASQLRKHFTTSEATNLKEQI